MADIEKDIRDLFRPLPEEVGFEISYEDDAKRLDLEGLAFVTWRLWWCREYVSAVAAYAQHVLDPDGSGGEFGPEMAELVAALGESDPEAVDQALSALVRSRINATQRSRPASFDDAPFPYLVSSDGGDLRIEFVAGIHENPTRMAFLVLGAVIPVTLMVMIVGMSGLIRQHGEPECLRQARATTDRRFDMLAKMQRLEGHMSPALQDNLNSIIRAGDAAERSCRSLLDRFDYKVTVPPDFTFEAALGATPPRP